MKKLLLLCLSLTFFIGYSFAQHSEECASGIIHERLMQNDPAYAKRIQENEALIQRFQKNPQNNKSGSVLEIPVVVHIIHTGQSIGTGANISMTQINSAITRMNDRYRNAHSSSVDTEIQFVLAKRDPSGNATTGVNRVNGSGVTNYSADGVDAGGGVGANETAVKDLSRWPNTQYYNIWVITEIEGNNGQFGIQGYAYFPGASASIDGTIIMHTCFGTTGTVNSFNNEGRTLVHELGHGLNLYHTFQGDSNGSSCPTGNGDEVADTEPHIRAASNCPTGTNSCTGVAYAGVTDNFMNYSSQTCALEFTAGQSTRMRAAILASRPHLASSLGGTTPGTYIGAATCTTVTVNPNNAFGMGIIGVNIAGVNVVSSATNPEGSYIDHSKHQLMEVNVNDVVPVTINTGTANNEDVKVYIDFNGDGDFADAGEEVFSSTGTKVHTGSITMPSTATNGVVRLRVISDWESNTITSSCYNPTYGQTEDYAIEVKSIAAPLSVNVVVNDVSCNGASDGSISLSAAGGTSPYTYVWSSGVIAGGTASNLAAGFYSVTVSDAVGSTLTSNATVNEPSQVFLSAFSNPDTCNLGNGVADALAFGGVIPYVYLWNTGFTVSTYPGLNAGQYTVTVTDANGCTDSASVTVNSFCPGPAPVPQNLRVHQVTSTSAKLKWDTISIANVYRIQYRAQGSPNWTTLFKYNNVGVMGISGLSINTAYEWHIAAKVNGAYGPYSALDQFTTLSGACTAATGFSVDKLSTSGARMNWTPSPQAVRQKGRFRAQGSSAWNQTVVSSTRSAYRVSGLPSGTTFEWQVQTICALGTKGTWSATQTFTTLTSGPSISARMKSSIIENKFETMDLYPNPAKGSFNLSLPSSETAVQIELLDLQGRVVMNRTFNSVAPNQVFKMDIEGFSPGVYFIRVFDAENQKLEKLIVH